MPTKRKRRTHGLAADTISSAAIAAFKAGDWHGVNRALGIRPWQISPMDAHKYSETISTVHGNTIWLDSLPRAKHLRAELERLTGTKAR